MREQLEAIEQDLAETKEGFKDEMDGFYEDEVELSQEDSRIKGED
jgi:hypothetical protein